MHTKGDAVSIHKRYMHLHHYCGPVHNSQYMESANTSTNRRWAKENAARHPLSTHREHSEIDLKIGYFLGFFSWLWIRSFLLGTYMQCHCCIFVWLLCWWFEARAYHVNCLHPFYSQRALIQQLRKFNSPFYLSCYGSHNPIHFFSCMFCLDTTLCLVLEGKNTSLKT